MRETCTVHDQVHTLVQMGSIPIPAPKARAGRRWLPPVRCFSAVKSDRM